MLALGFEVVSVHPGRKKITEKEKKTDWELQVPPQRARRAPLLPAPPAPRHAPPTAPRRPSRGRPVPHQTPQRACRRRHARAVRESGPKRERREVNRKNKVRVQGTRVASSVKTCPKKRPCGRRRKPQCNRSGREKNSRTHLKRAASVGRVAAEARRRPRRRAPRRRRRRRRCRRVRRLRAKRGVRSEASHVAERAPGHL